MFAIQGSTLPANFGAYPVTVQGVEGHVISLDGKSAFFPASECDKIGDYFRRDRDVRTAPTEIVDMPPSFG